MKHTYETLAADHAEWSRDQFGHDLARGPQGPLAHLLKEVRDELIPAPFDQDEYADALLLILDASRRAGITSDMLIFLASRKLEVNKKRQWQSPNEDGSVEHVRS